MCARLLEGGTYRFESSNVLVPIRREVLLSIVNRHAPLDIGSVLAFSTQLSIWVLRHSLVGPVFMPEVHYGRPIVCKIFRISACCATALLADIPLHGCVESIATDDLMKVSRGDTTGLD
jgi:hypothetical protein